MYLSDEAIDIFQFLLNVFFKIQSYIFVFCYQLFKSDRERVCQLSPWRGSHSLSVKGTKDRVKQAQKTQSQKLGPNMFETNMHCIYCIMTGLNIYGLIYVDSPLLVVLNPFSSHCADPSPPGQQSSAFSTAQFGFCICLK